MSEPIVPCGVCGAPACAGSGNYAVCSEYCDMVAKQFTVRDEEIAALKAECARRKEAFEAQRHLHRQGTIVREDRIAALEKVAEAAAEWFGPSLQDARFETVAVIKALREAGYNVTKEHIL